MNNYEFWLVYIIIIFSPFDVGLKYDPGCDREIRPQIFPHTLAIQDLFSAVKSYVRNYYTDTHQYYPVYWKTLSRRFMPVSSVPRQSCGFLTLKESFRWGGNRWGSNPLWKQCHSGQNTARLQTNVSGLSATTTLHFWQQKWVMASAVCICLRSQSNSEPLDEIATPHVFIACSLSSATCEYYK